MPDVRSAVPSSAEPAAKTSPTSSRRPVIAIDGPAGAGKSTLAAHLARRFGFLNLETGAMYRALALKAIENDLDFDEEAPLLELAHRHAFSCSRRSMATACCWMAWTCRAGFATRM